MPIKGNLDKVVQAAYEQTTAATVKPMKSSFKHPAVMAAHREHAAVPTAPSRTSRKHKSPFVKGAKLRNRAD